MTCYRNSKETTVADRERMVGDEIREVARGPVMQGLIAHDDIFGSLPLKPLESLSRRVT